MKYIYYKLSTADGAELDGPYYAASFGEMEQATGLHLDPFTQRDRFIQDNRLEYTHTNLERAPFNIPDRIKENFAAIPCLGWLLIYCPAKELREQPQVATRY